MWLFFSCLLSYELFDLANLCKEPVCGFLNFLSFFCQFYGLSTYFGLFYFLWFPFAHWILLLQYKECKEDTVEKERGFFAYLMSLMGFFLKRPYWYMCKLSHPLYKMSDVKPLIINTVVSLLVGECSEVSQEDNIMLLLSKGRVCPWVLKEWIKIIAILLKILLKNLLSGIMSGLLLYIFVRFIHVFIVISITGLYLTVYMYQDLFIQLLITIWLVYNLGLLQILLQWIYSYVYIVVHMCICFCWVYT